MPAGTRHKALVFLGFMLLALGLVGCGLRDIANENKWRDLVESGMEYLAQEQYEKAIENFDEAIRIDPLLPAPHTFKGYALKNQGNYYRAVDSFDEAIRLDPQDFLSYVGRGVAYNNLGQFERALQDYDEAIQLDFPITPTFVETYARVYAHRGLTYTNLGQYQQALEDYTDAVRLDPQNEVAKKNKAELESILNKD